MTTTATTALSCGNAQNDGYPARRGVRWVGCGARPGREELDPVLAELEGRLLVAGTDADLAAVVLRLLRTQRLADVVIGYLPVADSPASRLWNIPTGVAAFEFACEAPARPAPLVRDDAGGVVVGAARIAPITGQVYCDDEVALGGAASSLVVAPDPAATALPEPTADPLASSLEPAQDGVQVTVLRRGLLRRRREILHGRAVQASFEPATVTRDGVAHPRQAQAWGWYRHTEDLLLIR